MINLQIRKSKKIKSLKKPIYMSLEASIVGFISFVFGYHTSIFAHGDLSFWGGVWCMTNALGVLFAYFDDAIFWAKIRIQSNLIGCFCALIISVFFGSSYFTMFIAAFLTFFFTNFLGFEKNSRMSVCVVAFMMGVDILYPQSNPFLTALLRITETLFGLIFALFAVYISFKINIRAYSKA